jgi:hypothetical protein
VWAVMCRRAPLAMSRRCAKMLIAMLAATVHVTAATAPTLADQPTLSTIWVESTTTTAATTVAVILWFTRAATPGRRATTVHCHHRCHHHLHHLRRRRRRLLLPPPLRRQLRLRGRRHPLRFRHRHCPPCRPRPVATAIIEMPTLAASCATRARFSLSSHSTGTHVRRAQVARTHPIRGQPTARAASSPSVRKQ